MQVIICPRRVTQILALTVLSLTVASTAGQFAKFYLGHDHLMGFVPLFYLNGETNIPAWFSSSMLLLSSLLLAAIASHKKSDHNRFAPHWTVLSLTFLYLSADEAARLHERLGHALNTRWVIPFAIVGAALLPWYVKFMAHLPAKTRRLFIFAGVAYVAGAMGMEVVGWKYQSAYGTDHMGWKLVLTLEEFLEMTGIVIFIYALTSYIHSHITEPRPMEAARRGAEADARHFEAALDRP